MRINANKNSLKRIQTPSGDLGNLLRVSEFSDPSEYTLTTTEVSTTATTNISKIANSTLVITVFMNMSSSGATAGLTRASPLVALEYSTDGGGIWTRYDSPTDISGTTTTSVVGGYNDRPLSPGSNKLFFIMENVSATNIMFRLAAKKTNNNSTCSISLKYFVEEYYDDVNNFGADRDLAGVLGVCGVGEYVNASTYTVSYYDTGGLTMISPAMEKDANTDVLVRFSVPAGCHVFNDGTNSGNATYITYFYSEDGSNWITLGWERIGASTRMAYSSIGSQQFKITNLSKPYIYFRISIARPSYNTFGANTLTIGTGSGAFKSSIRFIELRRPSTPGVVNLRSKTRVEYDASVYTGITTEADVFTSTNMTITSGSSMLVEMDIGGYKDNQAKFNGVTVFRLYYSLDNGLNWSLLGDTGIAIGTYASNSANTNRYSYNNQALLRNIISSQIKFKITALVNGSGTAQVNNNGAVGTKYMTRMKFMEIMSK